MAYIFLDESGDLGFDFFKTKTSHFFVITCLLTHEKKPIEKIIKKAFQALSTRKVRARHGVLHCTREDELTKRRVFQSLAQKDCQILAIYLNKKKVFAHLKDQPHILYNFVTNILLDRIYNRHIMPLDHSIHLIASRRETNRLLNENFKSYLTSQIAKNHQRKIQVSLATPAEEKCLQIADFACWAIFRKLEKKDEKYYEMIKEKITEESPLFP